MEHRGSGNEHVAWARKLKELLQALTAYVKQHHPRGPSWNASGIPVSQISGASPLRVVDAWKDVIGQPASKAWRVRPKIWLDSSGAGVSASATAAPAATSAPKRGPGPPPPPMPAGGPGSLIADMPPKPAAASATGGGGDMSQLLTQLNRVRRFTASM